MSQDINPLAPGVPCGVDEAMIQTLVHAFYARVRSEELLGPIFNAAIDDWDGHLAKLCAFWSSVTLMTGRYKGTPMQAHAALPDLAGHHFEKWLALFSETAHAHCPPDAAALFVERAGRIANSLQIGIALHRGELTPAVRRPGA